MQKEITNWKKNHCFLVILFPLLNLVTHSFIFLFQIPKFYLYFLSQVRSHSSRKILMTPMFSVIHFFMHNMNNFNKSQFYVTLSVFDVFLNSCSFSLKQTKQNKKMSKAFESISHMKISSIYPRALEQWQAYRLVFRNALVIFIVTFFTNR